MKSRLKQESFYSELYKENQSLEYGDAVINALIETYSKDKNEYNKFYQAITQVFKAKEIVQDDPVSALRISKKAWELSKNPVIDSNIRRVIANNIYYKQKIVPSEENEFNDPSLFITDDKTSFSIINVFNKMYTGRVSKDSLFMDENFNYSYINSFSPQDTLEKSYTPLKSLGVKDNTILGIENDGKLTIWANGKKVEAGSIPNINKSTITNFSPDQNYLVTAPGEVNELNFKEDTAVILWAIQDLKRNSAPAKIILDSNNTNVKQITFAPNSRQFFVLDNYYLKIYNLSKQEPVIIPGVLSAQFSESGKYILLISPAGSLNVRDSIGQSTSFRPIRIDAKYLNDLKSFSVSPDWKKILLKQDGKLFILEREGGGPVLSTNSNDLLQPLKLNSKYFSQDKNLINTAVFIDNNSILSVNKNGNVFLWKTYAGFTHTNDQLSSIELPDLTIAEKLEIGSVSFKEIQSSNDEHVLREAAIYFERKSNGLTYNDEKNYDTSLNRTILLYKKLLSSTTGNKQLYYLDKLTTLNRNFKDVHSTDTTEQMMMVQRINENVELLKKQSKSNLKDSALTKRLSSDYNELSFHLIFIKQYSKSIEACKEGLKLNPANDIIYTNMALALLLSKKFAKAEKIYDTYKDKWIQNSSLSFKEGFLGDFEDFERAGVITPKEKDVYDKVQDVKKMLENLAGVNNNAMPSNNLRTLRK
ncbi:MAG: WD40 repeat domain-containing protein [Ginsengibacter sp.]